MDATYSLPPAAEINSRIRACRDELAALKRLLRAARAAEAANAARDERRSPASPRMEAAQ